MVHWSMQEPSCGTDLLDIVQEYRPFCVSLECHDRDIPPQPSHTYSCPLTVQTPPEHSLTKPEPIPGLRDPSIAFPNSSAAFPKGCCTDICLVSIPEAVNTIPEHI